MSESVAPNAPHRPVLPGIGKLGLRLPGTRGGRGKAKPGYHRLENPSSGTEIADSITLFHDAAAGAFACTVGSGPWIRLTAYRFEGSYLSLAMNLRKSDLRRVRPGTDLLFGLNAAATRPMTVYTRLNLRSAERTETLYETVVLHERRHDLRFALDGIRLPYGRIAGGWLDLIFSEPAMREVDIRGMEVSFVAAGAAHG